MVGLVLLCGLYLSPFAQQQGRMETDRPDQTETFYITKKGYLQAEIGCNTETYGSSRVGVLPTALWKLGLHERFELRLITEVNSVRSFPIPGSGATSGLLPLQIGGKVALWEEKKWIPATSLIFHFGTPSLGSKVFRTPGWSPNFRFTMQHTLGKNTALGYNLGAEWDGYSNSPTFIYTVAPGINLGERWYAYAEAFGHIRKGESPAHALDGGIAYYVSDDIKVDVSAGFGLTAAAIRHYAALGCSFRFSALGNR